MQMRADSERMARTRVHGSSGQGQRVQPGEDRVEITLFGPPSVVAGGRPVRIPRRQARALLYRLAAQAAPVPRDALCFLFWPDVPDATARRHLTRLLAHLHRDLPGLIVADSDSAGLNPERVQSDAAAFELLAGSADEQALRRAVDLYRGPFLAGFSLPGAPEFESWAFQEQQRLERRYLEILAGLVEAHSSGGRYKEAIALAERYLETNALAEGMHRRLIELYAIAGDRAAALLQYERCVALLERELGVGPLPETEAVYQAVLRNEVPARGRPAPAPGSVARLASPADSPLVGRDDAWQALDALFAGARAGVGRAVLLTGEAGIGKSRLMLEFAEARAGQAVILAAGCYPGAQPVPYLPLVEALRPHLRAERLAGRVDPVWLAEASALLPELRAAFPQLPAPAPATPEQARARLFEALRQLVLGLGGQDDERGPVLLLCLDDLHWADRATLNWLAYLGRHLAGLRALVMGTYRAEEPGAVGDLRRELRRATVLAELSLPPLAEEDVARLLRVLAPGRQADDATARRLHTISGGNPFFLAEIVRMLPDSGNLDNLPLPATVQEAVRGRVARLSGEAQQVLAAGAVLGPRFAFPLVQATAGRGEGETVEALDELVGHALLLEDQEANDYRFRHELIRLAVMQDLTVRRRQLLSRRAAQALEASLTGRPRETWPVSRLGQLYAEAGDARRAVPYLIQAGDQARNLYAHDEAVACYQQALPLLEGLGDEHQAARTRIKLGLTYHAAFDFRRAGEMYDQGLAAWQRTGRPVAAPRAPHPLRLPWKRVSTLDPGLASDSFSAAVVQHLFASPAELSPELDVVPDLATAWQVRDEGHTYVVHLRDDLSWTDGRPVLAADFEAAWKRVLDPATGSDNASLWQDLKGARALHAGAVWDADRVGVHAAGDRTLVVELEEPVSYFPQLLTLNSACAVPRHALAEHGAGWAEPESLVSSGPFRLESIDADGVTALVRDESYHGRFAGNLERVELYGGLEPGTFLEMYDADLLDVIHLGLLRSRDAGTWAQQRHAGEYVSGPWLRTIYLSFNASRPPFHDPRVRRALAVALDRDELARHVLNGYEVAATGGFVPPGMPGHTPGIGLPYDPDEARHLLAAAGYPAGRGWPAIQARAFGTALFEATKEWLQARWREVLGIEVEWQPLEWGQSQDTRTSGTDLLFGGWVADYPDPDNFLRVALAQMGLLGADDEVTGLLEKARCATNQPDRLALYGLADRQLMAGGLVAPLLYGRLHLLVKPWVRRFPVSPVSWWFWKEIIIEPH